MNIEGEKKHDYEVMCPCWDCVNEYVRRLKRHGLIEEDYLPSRYGQWSDKMAVKP